MKLDIIILAAGMGKRMRSDIPKVIHPIGGIPMLERVVNTAQKLNPQNIYVVHGNGGDHVKSTLPNLPVEWIKQEPQLGTAHAAAQVVDFIDKDSNVLILYGDVPLISENLLQSLAVVADNSIGIITAKVKDPKGLGRIVRDDNDNIIGIVEHKDADITQLKINEINTGIMLLSGNLLKSHLPRIKNRNAQKEYYLTDIISLAVANKKMVHSILANEPTEVLGVNDKYQLAHAERYFQLVQAKQLMQQGLTLLDPNRFDLRGNLEFGKDVTIDVNVVVSGEVKLGNNVKILANCVIEDAIIENNCTIGPFARIRPGSHIKNSAKVGNFVEIKNTTLGEKSKASHLSYLGDSTIGSKVNIGAGNITCNYDGVNKHQTIIKDNAFIGSNCQLVAPVTIGKNAVIGAGSTITKNAPADQLTIARTKQRSIAAWKKPEKKK